MVLRDGYEAHSRACERLHAPSLLLLWRHEADCSGRLFKDGVAVGVGKSEVDKLHVADNHDARRLQVAVHNLLATTPTLPFVRFMGISFGCKTKKSRKTLFLI